jgi:SAM-dependent methyltransferase
VTTAAQSPLLRFRAAYAEHRAAEGRSYDRDALLALPYLTHGPFARDWTVRARTFDAFVASVLIPAARTVDRPLRLLDVGAGNAWLSWRVAHLGVEAVAVDLREDDVDGLGAAREYLEWSAGSFRRVVASFDALPVADARFDLVVFNASLHYACDLASVLREARRTTLQGGRIVILDSPFYERDADGAAMVAEKLRTARHQFGDRVEALTALPVIEYLTPERLVVASRGLELAWRCRRVRYPLWYEMRPIVAWIQSRRAPSRFDVWECTVR